MSLASFDARESTMTWAGIGNVEGILVRGDGGARPPRELLTPRGGVVGYVLSSVRMATLAVAPGDTLILATDGIRSGFTVGVDVRLSPQEVASAIFTRHARGADDALVLVARYRGRAP
jgi:serine phosphatase RsbU (regulator of sigma subunit)